MQQVSALADQSVGIMRTSDSIREYLQKAKQKISEQKQQANPKCQQDGLIKKQHITQTFSVPCLRCHHDEPSCPTQSKSPLTTAISVQCDRTSRNLGKFFECSLSVISMPPPPTIGPNRAVKSTFSDQYSNNKDKSNLVTSDHDKDTDTGYAWIILATVFAINASTFGTARAYGLIFDKLAREDDQSRAEAAMPFTIMGAVENMAGPLSGYMLARIGSWRATVCIGSCLITLAHLFASVLESQVSQLLTMGLMCGLGLSLVTISFFQVNNAYFVRYRSTAFGLGLTGAALGTLYISPLCQYFLDHHGTSMCYLILSLILLPNVPLSLLLKPKAFNDSSIEYDSTEITKTANEKNLNQTTTIPTISGELEGHKGIGIWSSIKQVVGNPLFHLIWPTQLLFCWFNFVFGMIIVDFGKDRGLSNEHVAHLVPIWAFGQLVGRMLLGSLVDLKYISYRSFTVICFISISSTTWALNNMRVGEDHLSLLISTLVFALSMFISLLYILFNGLIVNYVETPLQPLSIGISSFTGSFFLLPRASVIGHYRDTTGNYDAMLTMFTYTSLTASLMWLLVPSICGLLRDFYNRRFKTNRTFENCNLIHIGY